MYRNRGNKTRGGGGAMRQKVAQNTQNRRLTPFMPNFPAVNEVSAATKNDGHQRRIPWRRNPAPSRPSRTQPYQIPGKSTKLNVQCFDLTTKNESEYPSDYAETNTTNRNAQNQRVPVYDVDTKDRIPTEHSEMNRTYENSQNSHEQHYDVDTKDRIKTDYAQMNGAYENAQNSGVQRVNFNAQNRISTEYAPMNGAYENSQNSRVQRVNFNARNRFPTKYNKVNGTYGNSQNTREQYPNFVARSHPSKEYTQTNGTLKSFQNSRYKQPVRDNVKSAPYHVPIPMQNRAQDRGYYTTETPAERTQQTRIQENSKAPVRKIWKTKIQLKDTSKVASAQSAHNEPKSVSNFITPSPWFSKNENVKSGYQKQLPEIRPLLDLAYEDIFKTPINEPDTFRNTVRSGWNSSGYATKTLEDDIVPLDGPYYKKNVGRGWNTPAYAKKDLRDETVHLDNSYSKTPAGRRWNASDYAPKDLPDDTVHLDDSHSKNSVTSKWVVPPELNMSIESGEFFSKVCEAVLEKVLQQLCPDSRKATQKPGAKSFNVREYSDRSGDLKNHMVNGSWFLQNRVPQRSTYAQFSKNRSDQGYKRHAPTPSFRQPQAVSSGRVEKRKKILTRNGKSLVYV